MPFFMIINFIPEEKCKKHRDTFQNFHLVICHIRSNEILNNIVSDIEEKTKYVLDLRKKKGGKGCFKVGGQKKDPDVKRSRSKGSGQ